MGGVDTNDQMMSYQNFIKKVLQMVVAHLSGLVQASNCKCLDPGTLQKSRGKKSSGSSYSKILLEHFLQEREKPENSQMLQRSLMTISILLSNLRKEDFARMVVETKSFTNVQNAKFFFALTVL